MALRQAVFRSLSSRASIFSEGIGRSHTWLLPPIPRCQPGSAGFYAFETEYMILSPASTPDTILPLKTDKDLRGCFYQARRRMRFGLSPVKSDNEAWRKSDRKAVLFSSKNRINPRNLRNESAARARHRACGAMLHARNFYPPRGLAGSIAGVYNKSTMQ